MTKGVDQEATAKSVKYPEKESPFFIKELINIPELRAAKKKFCGPNLLDTVGVNLLCWLQLTALAATALLAAQQSSLTLKILLYIYVLVFSARALRGLEGMFHEGGHRLIHKSERINDILTNFFGGALFGRSIQAYRKPHWEHHRYLANETEDDRVNYNRRNYAELDRNSWIKYGLGILKRYPCFYRDWFKHVSGSRFHIFMMLTWHTAALLILVLLLGRGNALFVMLLNIWLPMFLILPAFRMIGEAEEHPYEKIPTSVVGPKVTFDATLNNVGLMQQVFIHPFGDCWHIIHHLIPTCRQIRQRTIHRLLMENSTAYRQSILTRARILQEEQRYAE